MKNGKIVPYSLVGSPNWFMRQKEISEKRKIRQKAVTKLGGDYASPLNREEDDKGRNA